MGNTGSTGPRLLGHGNAGRRSTDLPTGATKLDQFPSVPINRVTMAHNQYNTPMGEVKEVRPRARLSYGSVQQKSMFDYIKDNLSKNVAQVIALHALAVAFPPVGLAVAAYSAIKVVAVGAEVYKFAEDYNAGTATEVQARQVGSDVAQMATRCFIQQGLAFDVTGNSYSTNIVRDFIADTAGETSKVFGGYVAANVWHSYQKQKSSKSKTDIQYIQKSLFTGPSYAVS